MSQRTEYAVTVTAKERAELLPAEVDRSPLKPGEVSGRTRASLISAGTELASAFQGSHFPRVPGYAAVFEVEETGSEVRDIRPGDLVLAMGQHRSFQRFTRADVLPLPPGLTPEVAVFARMMAVTMSTLVTTTARPPDPVLVTGLGLVGHLGSKIFHACGYEVIACDPDESRRRAAIEGGVAGVRAAMPLDDPALAGKVALVLECSGHEQALLEGCRMVRPRGEVVCVGAPWQRRTDTYAHDLHHVIFFKYVVVRSGWEWEIPIHPMDFRAQSIFGNLEAAMRWLASGRVRADGLYRLLPPRSAQQAYEDLLHKRAPKLAVVFDWRDCP